MDFIQAIILGVIEGITEFLPISSTGHLILASNFLKIEQTEFVKTFEIAIQSGAILSVVFLYRRTIFPFLYPRDTHDTLDTRGTLLKQVFVAFIPTAIIGFTLYKFIKQYLIGSSEIVLLSLFLGGIVLIAIELLFKNRASKKSQLSVVSGQLSYERAFAIGLFQSISMVPGVSRAAATIIGGMLVGLPRKTAVEFSFLLAVPTMIAATALDLKETSFVFNSNEWAALTTGFIISFIVALIAIKWLLKYVQSNNFILFGVYRIVISLAYFIFIIK